MNELVFVQNREPDWKRLTQLCDRAEASLKALQITEYQELVHLYRKASEDLAIARTRSANPQLIDFLNDLVGRAYSILYQVPRSPFRKAVGQALVIAAITARRRAWYLFVSAAIFFGAAIFVFGLSLIRPQTVDHFFPPGPGGERDPNVEQWTSGDKPQPTTTDSLVMSGFYMSNNPRVAIITGAMAAGSFGVLTGYILFMNGGMLGALAKEMADVGRLPYLLISVAPHGVTEIKGIIFSGAAGLILGWALINPGRKKRGHALMVAGKDALVLLVTAVILMFIAAPVEGFFSFNPNIPLWLKAVFAALTAVGWAFFWIGYAAKLEPEEERAPVAA
jgi:uncharacterized membrane protein SpoIIM required for sporulation